MGCYSLNTVIDPLLSGDSYVLHNYGQYEFLSKQVLPPHDKLAGMHHASVHELVGYNVVYCQQLYPTQVVIYV